MVEAELNHVCVFLLVLAILILILLMVKRFSLKFGSHLTLNSIYIYLLNIAMKALISPSPPWGAHA